MADPKKISQLTPAASVNANDYTVLVDGNNSTNKRATISQILASGVIGGTVTSVNATGSNGVGVSGGPITTSGTLNISLGAITPTSVAASGSVTGSNLSGTNTGDQTIQLVGDVEAAAGAPTLTTSIASGAVTNAKLANMTGPSLKGRVAAGVGAVSDLSAAQVATILPAVIGDSGSGGTQGLVPAPAAGDASAKKFLRADATWAAPAINDLLPSQSGQSGKVLKSDGTNVAWQADSGGSGTVTSVGLAGGTDITVSGSPVTTSGTITVGLSTSGVGAGTYGSATQVPAITVDSKGRITAAANTAIAIPSTAVSGLASVATTGAYSSLTGTPALGTISSQNSNNVTITGGSITGISALAVNSGGTGATSAIDARTNLGLGTIATQAANNVAITGGTMSNVQVSGLPNPVNASDAATKYYVDTFAQGLNPQAAVRAGTTGNITLSGLQTIDGVVLVASDRVLVKNQTNSAENGIYVAAAGAWSRATDANTAAELARGNYYMITEGTANIGDGWVIQTAPSNLGVDPVVFALFTNTVAAVSSISGTASQISASSSTGAITLSLPNTLVAPGTLTASGGITNTAIGASNPSTGAFTTLSTTGNATIGTTSRLLLGGNENLGFRNNNDYSVIFTAGFADVLGFGLGYGAGSTRGGLIFRPSAGNDSSGIQIAGGGSASQSVGAYLSLEAINAGGSLAAGSAILGSANNGGSTNQKVILQTRAIDRLTVASTGEVSVSSSTASTSTTTGALVVTGGVGVGGAINAGGNLTVSGTASSFGGTNTGGGEVVTVRGNSTSTGGSGQILVAGAGASFTKQLALGYNTTDNYGTIQANQSGVGTQELKLNPLGGLVSTGSNLTVSGTTGVTATDLTLGTSGPSVKSSLSARAPRQGLVSAGSGTLATIGTTSPFGLGDFTIAVWCSSPVISPRQSLFDTASGQRLDIYVEGATGILSRYNGTAAAITSTVFPVNKMNLIVITRSGGYIRSSINAAAFGADVADTTDYSVALTKIGSNNIGNQPWLGTISTPLFYNRALSASEVVALYEAGAPAGADYNSASNTNAATNWTNSGIPYTTFSGGSATGFTATSNGTGGQIANISPTTFPIVKGTKWRVTCTLTLNSGTAPSMSFGSTIVANLASNVQQLSAGSNTIEFTVTSTTSSSTFYCYNNSTAANFSISGFTLTPLGLLLAPDAAQAGGGLVWYDTSGNAANITIPASGVSWNVPTSGYVTSGSSLNLSAGGTNQNITLTPSGTGNVLLGSLFGFDFTNTRLGVGTQSPTASFHVVSGSKYLRATISGTPQQIISDGTRIVYYGINGDNLPCLTAQSNDALVFGTNNSEKVRLFANGNFGIGTGSTDSGQRLQVNGTAFANRYDVLFNDNPAGTSPRIFASASAGSTVDVLVAGAGSRAGNIQYYNDGGGTSQLKFGTSVPSSTTEHVRFSMPTSGLGSSVVSIYGTTDSTSTTTGALTVAGGVGIAKKLYVADWITSTGSSAALFFNSRTGANSNYAWYSPDGTVARLYDNTNAKTLVDFAANTGDATFAGTVKSTVATGGRTLQATPSVTVAQDAVQNLVTQNYGFFLISEVSITGSIAIIGFNAGGTYLVWQEGTNYSTTINTASKFNVYYSSGNQLVVQNKKTQSASFNIINLAGGS